MPATHTVYVDHIPFATVCADSYISNTDAAVAAFIDSMWGGPITRVMMDKRCWHVHVGGISLNVTVDQYTLFVEG